MSDETNEHAPNFVISTQEACGIRVRRIRFYPEDDEKLKKLREVSLDEYEEYKTRLFLERRFFYDDDDDARKEERKKRAEERRKRAEEERKAEERRKRAEEERKRAEEERKKAEQVKRMRLENLKKRCARILETDEVTEVKEPDEPSLFAQIVLGVIVFCCCLA